MQFIVLQHPESKHRSDTEQKSTIYTRILCQHTLRRMRITSAHSTSAPYLAVAPYSAIRISLSLGISTSFCITLSTRQALRMGLLQNARSKRVLKRNSQAECSRVLRLAQARPSKRQRPQTSQDNT